MLGHDYAVNVNITLKLILLQISNDDIWGRAICPLKAGEAGQKE